MSSKKQTPLPRLEGKPRSNSKVGIATVGKTGSERLPSIPNSTNKGRPKKASFTPSSTEDSGSETESEDPSPRKSSTPKRSAKFEATSASKADGDGTADVDDQAHFDYRHRKSFGKVVTFEGDPKPFQLSRFYKKELEIPSEKMNKVCGNTADNNFRCSILFNQDAFLQVFEPDIQIQVARGFRPLPQV